VPTLFLTEHFLLWWEYNCLDKAQVSEEQSSVTISHEQGGEMKNDYLYTIFMVIAFGLIMLANG